MSEQVQGEQAPPPPAPTSGPRKFSRKARRELVEIDDDQFWVCNVPAGVIGDWKTECSNALTYGPDSRPTGVRVGARDADIALLGCTMYPNKDHAPAPHPVGYDFAKALPSDVVQELAKDARRLNGINVPGVDDAKKPS